MECNIILLRLELVSDIDDIESTIGSLCEELPKVQKITQIKGIGIATASGGVAELRNIREYRTPKQMIKMAGLSLTGKQLGSKESRLHYYPYFMD